ncbi:hypothetical protein C3489_31340 [Streptomyces sp. Ru71]|uniref:hypothetical protein n=1 Tax=Streptomyces sp. Ru71 TaxID=2080746 RepID=UPI000CDDB90C|nr:hypothetical protein [Streptomyces sp. Ru71]POX46689.1 hypothetical protein C3489_31340 [Streptomyces sp. Ru71]
MDLDTVADELYGLRPEDFTAARNARAAAARKAGDRSLAGEIARLRRPSLSAWAANLLVRERPDAVAPLLELGEGLRQAHRELDGGQLRELTRRQRSLVGALARQARQLAEEAGHPIGDDAQREVEATLHAVLADPEAADAWSAGRLVKPLDQPVGFPVAEAQAVRRTATAATKATAKRAPAPARRDSAREAERRRRLERAREDADAAQRELDAAEKEAADIASRAADAERRAQEGRRLVGELRERLERAEEEQRAAQAAEREAHERARTADRRLRESRRRAMTAATRLAELEGADET